MSSRRVAPTPRQRLPCVRWAVSRPGRQLSRRTRWNLDPPRCRAVEAPPPATRTKSKANPAVRIWASIKGEESALLVVASRAPVTRPSYAWVFSSPGFVLLWQGPRLRHGPTCGNNPIHTVHAWDRPPRWKRPRLQGMWPGKHCWAPDEYM